MITNTKQTILPLDLNGISELIKSDGGTFKQINYRLEYINASQISLIIETPYLEPDSINITINKSSILLHGQMNLNISLQQDSQPINLSKNTVLEIPLPNGIDRKSIFSNIEKDRVCINLNLS